MNIQRMVGIALVVVAVGFGWSEEARASGPCEDPPVDVSAGPVLQAVSWIATIPYTAVKGVVALAGGVVSIPVYILSLKNEKVTRAIWLPAVSGTFILTPAHLTGKQPIRFLPSCPDA